METGSFNAPSSPESMQNDDDNRDRCNLSLFSRNRSVRMGTSERLEQYGASTGTLCQPLNEQGGPTNTQHLIPSSCSWKHKLGTFAIIILIVGSILLCTAVGTLAFLWFGNPDIPTWKETTARDWLSKAISICIGVIQQAMMLQLGVATATIASLALESGKVVIGDVASVSVMRATASSAGAFIMAWENLFRGKYRGARHSRIFLLVYSAATLWCLSQFLMLILLTDVSIRSTAGLVSTIDLPYSLHFIDMENRSFIGSSQFIEQSAGAWYRKLSQYASFAEYTEPSYEADGISDTGVTLRAFLPFRTAQERENLKSYKGKATVLDARVSCQVPQFRNATLGYDRGSFRLQGSLAPTRNTPRLTSATLDINNTAGSIDLPQDRWRDFDCLLDLHFGQPGTPTQESPVTLCQLWQSEHGDQNWGGLVSEFFDPPQMESEEVPVYAKPYLVLNQTMDYGPGFLYRDSQAYDSYERGEWKDMHYHEPDLAISASLCYAAFDFADIDVHISSKSNRTESRLEPVFDRETSTYNFAELRYAMGQDPSLLPDRRGILELEKQQWQAVPRENYTEYTALSWLFRSVTDLASKTSYNSTGAMSSYGTCTDCAQIEVMHVSTSFRYRPFTCPSYEGAVLGFGRIRNRIKTTYPSTVLCYW